MPGGLFLYQKLMHDPKMNIYLAVPLLLGLCIDDDHTG